MRIGPLLNLSRFRPHIVLFLKELFLAIILSGLLIRDTFTNLYIKNVYLELMYFCKSAL